MDSAGQFVSVAVVLALLGFAVWRFRAPGGRAPLWSRRGGGQLRVIERVALTPQHSLHLVSLGTEVMLIGAGPGGIELIRESVPVMPRNEVAS